MYNSSPDRFQIVCQQADKDGFHCPGANEFGACTLYTNYAVRAKARTGCAYRGIRAPIVKTVKKIRIGQQKQDKRKKKAGEKAVVAA